jgi:hypothetical protein
MQAIQAKFVFTFLVAAGVDNDKVVRLGDRGSFAIPCARWHERDSLGLHSIRVPKCAPALVPRTTMTD